MSEPLPEESQLAAIMRAGMLKRGRGGLEMPPPADEEWSGLVGEMQRLQDRLKRLKPRKATPTWTRVEDALPKCFETVLGWWHNCMGDKGEVWPVFHIEGEGWSAVADEWIPPNAITHWMPLPEGPK